VVLERLAAWKRTIVAIRRVHDSAATGGAIQGTT